MSTNNIYYVDMEQRFNDYLDGKINMRNFHFMVYDINNVSLALRQLSKSSGRMAKGIDGTNYATLENYSVYELSEIVKDRLLHKKMDYVRRTYIPKGNTGKMRPLGICTILYIEPVNVIYKFIPRADCCPDTFVFSDR